jgi:hypothetical protein
MEVNNFCLEAQLKTQYKMTLTSRDLQLIKDAALTAYKSSTPDALLSVDLATPLCYTRGVLEWLQRQGLQIDLDTSSFQRKPYEPDED